MFLVTTKLILCKFQIFLYSIHGKIPQICYLSYVRSGIGLSTRSALFNDVSLKYLTWQCLPQVRQLAGLFPSGGLPRLIYP